MFDWKVEDLKLINDKIYINDSRHNKHFFCEKTTSREDKIAFVDKM